MRLAIDRYNYKHYTVSACLGEFLLSYNINKRSRLILLYKQIENYLLKNYKQYSQQSIVLINFQCFVLPSGVNTVIAACVKVGVWLLQLLSVQHSISQFNSVQNARALRAPPRAKHAAFLSATTSASDKPCL